MAGKRWNGSTWVDHTTKKRWNGSTWVDLTTAKRWNGSTWVDIYAGGGGGGSLVFTPSDSQFVDTLFCNENFTACPYSDNQSDSVTYTVTGGTGPYTVVVTQESGPNITINHNTGTSTITLSTTCGRETYKRGEIKIVATDSLSASVTTYMPWAFSYSFVPGEGHIP